MKDKTLLPLVEEYTLKIREELMKEGISQEESAIILKNLEDSIYQSMSEDAIDNLSQEELEEFDENNDLNITPEEVSELLHVSENDVTIYYLRKMEEFLAKIPENITTIKQQLYSPSSTVNK